MGLYDRPYMKEDGGGGLFPGGGSPGGGRGMMVGMPRAGKAVKILLLINIVVFILQHLFAMAFKFELSRYFGATPGAFWQVWRYITFQFLHSKGGIWHIALNMLGLYMLGTPLEQRWGSRQFVKFYLTCGVVAGIAYVVIGNLAGQWMRDIPIVGASGGVYGVVLACAVLFPHFKLIFFLFPVPIRLACLIIFGGMFFVIMGGISSGQLSGQFWSDVAHLGGAVAAAVWIWVLPKFKSSVTEARDNINKGAWQRKMQRLSEQQAEIDRILDKIHEEGIVSLSDREKKILKEASKRQ